MPSQLGGNMAYFILKSGEDGTSINQLSEGELLKRITPDKDGDTYYGPRLVFLDKIPPADKGWWMADENAVIVIKGEIVKPKAVETATRYEL